MSETMILGVSIAAGAAVAALLFWKARDRCVP